MLSFCPNLANENRYSDNDRVRLNLSPGFFWVPFTSVNPQIDTPNGSRLVETYTARELNSRVSNKYCAITLGPLPIGFFNCFPSPANIFSVGKNSIITNANPNKTDFDIFRTFFISMLNEI